MKLTALALESVTESPTGAVEFGFRPTRPLRYRAGQGGLVILPAGGARPFTFAADDRSDRISIATTLTSGSRFKRALGSLTIGAHAFTLGPIGTPPSAESTDSQVLVAQGIGITPFLSLARSRDKLNATLLQVGAPHYFEEVASAVSRAAHVDHRDGLRTAIARAIEERPTASWYLSGRSDFVGSIGGLLSAAGVPASSVHKEAFWTMRAPKASVQPARIATA